MLFLNKIKKEKILAIAIALFSWQAIALILNNNILLVSPLDVIKKLAQLVITFEFWTTIFLSVQKIIIGLFLAIIAGLGFASCANRYKIIDTLLWPYISVMKATPVASFIIICLVWIGNKNLSILTVFLIVFPIVYSNMYEAFSTIDKKKFQMLKVFRAPFKTYIRCLYIPHSMPFFISTIKISIGMAFKSGIAAEVIGIPQGTIGNLLYEAKIFLSTSDMFAWTLVIITVSMIFEKVMIFLLNYAYKKVLNRG